MQFAQGFNPDAATVLNISQDHLDWHADMAEYVQAKAQIFGADTVQVLNRDDAAVMAMAQAQSEQINFGIHAPTEAGDSGLWREGGMDWLCVALADEVLVEKKKRGQEAAPVQVSLQRLMPADALQIRGRHNAMNALAALALCRAIDLPLAKLLRMVCATIKASRIVCSGLQISTGLIFAMIPKARMSARVWPRLKVWVKKLF